MLIATHNLKEAEVLCDQVAILVAGLVRQVGTVDEVRRWGIDDRRFRVEARRWPEGPSGPFRVESVERFHDEA